MSDEPRQAAGPPKRRWWHRIFLPLDAPFEFQDGAATLREKLSTQDTDVSAEILSHARELFDETHARADAAERRATTLLGALAIASSFGLAGGGLLLDLEKLPRGNWRIALTICYLTLIVGLVGAAFRSLETLRVKVWSRPGDDTIFERASLSVAEGRIQLAAELLYSTGRNRPVARWKVAQVRAAAWWLTLAILALLAVAFLIGLYALLG